MSYHLHFRAVPEAEIRDDYTWLEEFMCDAWDDLPAECAAGIADAIEKDFSLVNTLYAAAATLDETENGSGGSESWQLPIFGGRPVYHPDHSQPPLLILTPAETRTAADFLIAAPFDTLWEAAGAKIRAPFGNWDEAEVKAIFVSHHTNLRDFYRQTASAGQAVIKMARY
ncbi:DUF1877 family protein [Streptomyces inhibens]|uniref:DUF1877 family protein n=1 Tax=Streptomyces inhibens TaxID=2293571 RepID=UPI001EE70DD3|nr:DUF1877 family protein [Streptomyces inhibens]UKY50764.1 YfbM family protein [Streptomyces inhibens]